MPLILPASGEYEHEDKRSKFLAACSPVKNETEAKAFVASIRAKHPKANHNVFAYMTRSDNITRMSDDGEPTGSAGLPILNLFQKTGVVDWVCVVTRYFGGTLLGAGGLVRAYGHAAKGAMEAAAPTREILTQVYELTCPYNMFDRVKYDFGKLEIEIIDSSFTDKCVLTLRVTEDQEVEFHETVKGFSPDITKDGLRVVD
ncbi:MAG: YigZ family protein [Defluviitaleaceae bacterium]|nr:YigZ family protein [Defluviitaleaceae bacterium]